MINQLIKLVPDVTFTPGDKFCWSPKDRQIIYIPNELEDSGVWALLHETGHAILGHQNYQTDYELLKMEIEAWHEAKEVALKLGAAISEDHIQVKNLNFLLLQIVSVDHHP